MIAIGVLSAVLNILLLGGSIYMMLVYDMVLPSGSLPTLFGLAALLLLVYLVQGVLDFLRGRILLHFAAGVTVELNRDVHALVGLISRLHNTADGLQPVRDLDQIRGFLSGLGPTALVDLPWILFFGGLLFLLHPYIGLTVLGGGTALIALTLLTERLTNGRNNELTTLNATRMQVAETTRRHVEVIAANGMQQRFEDMWSAASTRHLDSQEKLSGAVSALSNLTKMLRMLLQSGVLTVGAILVIDHQASGGVIFASSILSSRALAPVEGAIGNWRGFVAARQSWARLKAMLQSRPEPVAVDMLPAPHATLSVDGLFLAPPGARSMTLQGIDFRLKAGDALAVLGPSGSGKSSLVRAIAGVWPLLQGHVRLDGADITQWPPDRLGAYLGYVPQNAELIAGTIAQNIARFDPAAPAERIVEAARLAGVHDLIVHLPDGYNSEVGVDGLNLSGGQRQRIALAQALYGDPFLIILDEPNSNLDLAGEQALADAIAHSRARGAIVVVVAHRPSVLSSVNLVLLLNAGRAQAFGSAEQLVPQFQAGARSGPVTLPGNTTN